MQRELGIVAVTGGATDAGAAVVDAVAGGGGHVVVLGGDPPRDQVDWIPADLADPDAVARAAATLVARLPYLAGLVTGDALGVGAAALASLAAATGEHLARGQGRLVVVAAAPVPAPATPVATSVLVGGDAAALAGAVLEELRLPPDAGDRERALSP